MRKWDRHTKRCQESFNTKLQDFESKRTPESGCTVHGKLATVHGIRHGRKARSETDYRL